MHLYRIVRRSPKTKNNLIAIPNYDSFKSEIYDFDQNLLPHQIHSKPIQGHIELPDETMDSIDIIITEVISPNVFWAQYDSEHIQHSIKQLHSSINQFGGTDFPRCNDMPQVGAKVLFTHTSSNNQLFRAIVTQNNCLIAGEEGYCSVFCVDYGWSYTVHFSDLKLARAEIFDMKYQCFQIKLAGVKISPDISRSSIEFQKAINTVKKILHGKLLIAKVVLSNLLIKFLIRFIQFLTA